MAKRAFWVTTAIWIIILGFGALATYIIWTQTGYRVAALFIGLAFSVLLFTLFMAAALSEIVPERWVEWLEKK